MSKTINNNNNTSSKMATKTSATKARQDKHNKMTPREHNPVQDDGEGQVDGNIHSKLNTVYYSARNTCTQLISPQEHILLTHKKSTEPAQSPHDKGEKRHNR
jgi:hypothetical protein